MKIFALILLSLIFFSNTAYGQNRKALEQERQTTLEEIQYVDNLIKETNRQKSSGIKDIRVIGSRLSMRENVIKGLIDEQDLLIERIALNDLALNLMENDLEKLKREYKETIVKTQRITKGNPALFYILSARDFNQGFKRTKYLKQIEKYRREQVDIIIQIKQEMQNTRDRMQDDLSSVNDLKRSEESQRNLLRQEQERKQQMVKKLSSREAQLRRELEEKKKNARKIESEIKRIVEEERKKALSVEITPEMKLISGKFEENKGRLPWPVEKGIITEKFGPQKHPVLANVIENNLGIEISTGENSRVRSIFNGVVVGIFAIPGENMSIIIQHGRYYSVYQNLVNISVRQGSQIEAKQEIGDVYSDNSGNTPSVLKFMIFFEREKLDPEMWIVKK